MFVQKVQGCVKIQKIFKVTISNSVKLTARPENTFIKSKLLFQIKSNCVKELNHFHAPVIVMVLCRRVVRCETISEQLVNRNVVINPLSAHLKLLLSSSLHILLTYSFYMLDVVSKFKIMLANGILFNQSFFICYNSC